MNVERAAGTHAQSAPLTDGVMLNAAVMPQNVPVKVDDVAGNGRLVFEQNLKIFARDKILTFLFFCRCQRAFFCHLENVLLFERRERKTHFFERCRRNSIQKIGLVFCAVGGTRNHCGSQRVRIFRVAVGKRQAFGGTHQTRVMTSAKIIVSDTHFFNARQKRAEFYQIVAANTWIRSPTSAVFSFEIIQHLFLILFFYVDNVIFNVVLGAEFFAVLDVLRFVWTVARAVQFSSVGQRRQIAFPLRHRNADNTATLFF